MRLFEKKTFLVAAAAMLIAASATQATQAGIVLPTTGAAGAGNLDPNYTLVSVPAGAPTSAYATTITAPWVNGGTGSTGWITPSSGPDAYGNVDASKEALQTGYNAGTQTYAPYDYQLKFLPSVANPVGAYTFNVVFAADDLVTIVFNGVTERTASLNPMKDDFEKLQTATFTANVLAGTNTVDFLVYNTGDPPITDVHDGPSGLLVTSFTGVTASAVPEPSTVVMVLSGASFGLVTFRRRKRTAA